MADARMLFAELNAESDTCFWLDSNGLSRFSFLGTGRHSLVHRAGQGGFEALKPVSCAGAPDRRHRPSVRQCRAGAVGYFGYEMKAECGVDRARM